MNKISDVLNIDYWKKANQQLIKKTLTEFIYEDMLQTSIVHQENNIFTHQLILHPHLYYEFKAMPRIFNHWYIKEDSILRVDKKQTLPALCIFEFIRDIYQKIGIDELTLGHFLRELNSTVVADCHLLSKKTTVNELLNLPNVLLEGHLQGHPWFVINKGRLGFSYHDYLTYSPEQLNPISLSWIAVRKTCAVFSAISTLSYEEIIDSELSELDRIKFNNIILQENLSPNKFFLMPIHEWQWQHQIVQLFARDIVEKNIIYLGYSTDNYLPTQSIRTFVNITHVSKNQVKLPLSIFNTAVFRGLPGERTQHAPLLTQWLKEKMTKDDYLTKECRLILLGEIASIDVPHKDYQCLSGVPYQYQELLGIIWRESVNNKLNTNETAITMAALIHTDYKNQIFIKTLIDASGLSVENWLNEFFSVTLPPLLHWLYKYGVVFSPHGENTMLIINNYRPVGLIIKDFIDDVNVSETSLPELNDLPQQLRNILLHVSDNMITQFIHTGLFVVLYRYLSDILVTYLDYSEGQFWQQVYKVIKTYHETHPELTERFDKFNLLKKSFPKMCLNRLRVLSVGYKDYAQRPKVDTFNHISNPAHPEVFTKWI